MTHRGPANTAVCPSGAAPVPGPTRMSGVAGDLGIRIVPRSVHTATRTCGVTGRGGGQLEHHEALRLRHGHMTVLSRAPHAVSMQEQSHVALSWCALLSGLHSARGVYYSDQVPLGCFV